MEVLSKLIVIMLIIATFQDTTAVLQARKVLHIPEKIIGGVIDIVQNHNKNKPAAQATFAQGQIQAQTGYVQGVQTPQQHTPWTAGSGQAQSQGYYGSYATGTYPQGSYGQYGSGVQNVQPTQSGQAFGQSQVQYQGYPQNQAGQFQVQNSMGSQNQFQTGQYQGISQMQFQNQGLQGSNQGGQLHSQIQQANGFQSQIQVQNPQGHIQGPIQQSPVFSGQNSQTTQFNGQNQQNPQYFVQNTQNPQLVGQNTQNSQFVSQNNQNGQYVGQNTQFIGTTNQNSQLGGQNQNVQYGQNTQPIGQNQNQFSGQHQQTGVFQGQGSVGGGFQNVSTGHTPGAIGPTCVCQAWTKPQPGEATAGKSEEVTEKPEEKGTFSSGSNLLEPSNY